MRVINKVLKYILSVILAIALIAYILIKIFSSTILNKDYMLSHIEKTNYYDNVYEYVNSNFEKYIYQSGLEKNVLDGIVSKERVQRDTVIMIKNIYDGSKEEVNTDEIKENLYNNIKESLGNRELTKTEQKAIDTFLEKISEEYNTTIMNTKYEQQIHDLYNKAVKYTRFISDKIILVIVCDLILLILFNIKRVYRNLKYIGISLQITGIFLIFINLFVSISIKIKNILIINDTVSQIIKNLLADILNIICISGISALLVGLTLTIISNVIFNIRKQKHRMKQQKIIDKEEIMS